MKKRKSLYLAVSAFTAFVLWTAAIMLIDVREIGPLGSMVGLASLNGLVHNATGIHMSLYTVTDLLSIIPFCFVLGFGLLGILQLIKRKSIFKVDFDILALGSFYAVVLAMFVLFEMLTVNYRPVLINGGLEASYPSSTTMLIICVMQTATIQFKLRIKSLKIKRFSIFLVDVFTFFMVTTRLLSGVHWFSDIIGGVLLSVGLVALYSFSIKKNGTHF